MNLLKIIFPSYGVVEKIIDHVRDKVVPIPGSILYCDLFLDNAQHSGVYVGDGGVVHLTGKGKVELTDTKKFLAGCTGNTIYVSCNGGDPVGSISVASRAISAVGDYRRYNLILNNCHQFSSGCLDGDFENSNSFLWMLKYMAEKKLNASTWRLWETGFIA